MKHVYNGLRHIAKGFEVIFVFVAALAETAANACEDWGHWCEQKIEDNE